MAYGLPSTQDQLASAREDSGGVALVLVDVCLSSFLTDHHNRDGELLLGVYVDGRTKLIDVRESLYSELMSADFSDRTDGLDYPAAQRAIHDLFDGKDIESLFDASLETLDEDEAETMGGDEMCQAWFVLTWDVPETEEPA